VKRVIILPDAEADIVAIWLHTLDRWGFDQAVKYDATIQDRIEGLAGAAAGLGGKPCGVLPGG